MRVILVCLIFLSLFSGNFALSDLPSDLQPIDRHNASELQEIAIVGRGVAYDLDWHPDGDRLAIASATGIWLLDETLQDIESTVITQPVGDLEWSPDGTTLAIVSTARDRCLIQIWDAEISEPHIILERCADTVEWNATGSYLAVFDTDAWGSNEVLLIDGVTFETMTIPGQDGTWSPSGDILFTRLRQSFTYSNNPKISAWDINSKEETLVLDISDINAGKILWGANNETITLSCSEYDDETDRVSFGLCTLNVQTGEGSHSHEIGNVQLGICVCLGDILWNSDRSNIAYEYNPITTGFLSRVSAVSFATDQSTYLGEGEIFGWHPTRDELTAIVGNGEIRTYDVNTGDTIAESQKFTSSVNMISIRPNKTEMASVSFGYYQDTHVWDITQSHSDPILSFYAEPAEIVDYTPDGTELIAGGVIFTDIVANQYIGAYDSETGENLRHIAGFYDQGDSPPVRYWNHDYTQYVEVEEGNIILPNDITLTTEFIVDDVFWSPDEKKIATVERPSREYNFYVRTWDVATGKNINQFYSSMNAYKGMVWSPTSDRIAVSLEHPASGLYDRGAVIFDVVEGRDNLYGFPDFQTFEMIDIDETSQQAKVTWNSDGTLIAVVNAGLLEIHDAQLKYGDPLVSLPAYNITDLEWASDDRFIVAGSSDGTLRVWGVPETSP